jgi:hypothetical protein
MGSELSACCLPSPVSQSDVGVQFEEIDESTVNSEDLYRRIYDLIVEDQSDDLQQLIYDNEIDLTQVFWKVLFLLIGSELKSSFFSYSIEQPNTTTCRCHGRACGDHSNADHQWT